MSAVSTSQKETQGHSKGSLRVWGNYREAVSLGRVGVVKICATVNAKCLLPSDRTQRRSRHFDPRREVPLSAASLYAPGLRGQAGKIDSEVNRFESS